MRSTALAGFLAASCWLAPALLLAQAGPRPEHPRPDFQRANWLSLNGSWDFRFDPEDVGIRERWWEPGRDLGARKISVPFCWESSLSGVNVKGGLKIGWYRRRFSIPAAWRGNHAWLRFDAVDWEARVWVNGKELGAHEGGYTPFEFDLAGAAEPGEEATVVVRAFDATDPELPRGKQTPEWYTYTSGIWQTVWLESRPARYISRFTLTARRMEERWFVDLAAEVGGPQSSEPLGVSSPEAGIEAREIGVEHGGARASLEVRNPKLWTPDAPHLYGLTLRLGEDAVETYFGLRTIGRGRYGDLPHESVLLNGEPVYLRGALDQSFNPLGIYTAPSDAFLRRDIELAKSAGLNLLRIHIKADEPRRLYWADRLGILLMQDMPSNSEHSPRSREAWENTMRAVIERDRNHPSIIAWVAFNETWGLTGKGIPPYAENRETQEWVLRMWKTMKESDPSRLVEDNSPNKRDHVETDLNSWHFYIGDYAKAQAHIAEVVAKTFPGSPFNYVPGRAQGSAPLINSEYGAVAAGGGDRDVSWGFAFLTTELRRYEKIQGYVYTELTDVEWEHNGLFNYDRTPKEFGYDAFVPGMTVRDLQGEDFIGYEGRFPIRGAAGYEIGLPIFVSHFSKRTQTPVLRWWVTGTDDLGARVDTKPQTRTVRWSAYRVVKQPDLEVPLPGERPFVGAVALELLDESGQRIAANFVPIVAKSAPAGRTGPSTEARVEVLGPRLVALRFAPTAVAGKPIDGGILPGKLWAANEAAVEYRVPLPDFVRKAGPVKFELLAELATHAGQAKVDWTRPQASELDYPQTDTCKFPGMVRIQIGGADAGQVQLPDDPADVRGVLSHIAGVHPGSYGYWTRVAAPAQALPEVTVRLEATHGLSVYGEGMGRYGVDPTILVHTASDLDRGPTEWFASEQPEAPRGR
ncbi:MAG: sugar-binding domain-containing protein [Bryobacteraceae bacterium]|jgi:hypothetical protein